MLWRLLIACVVYVVCLFLVPLVFGLIGIPSSAALTQIFRLVGALIVLAYVMWGPPLRPPVA